MAITIKFDNNGNPIKPSFILSTKSGKKIGYLLTTGINFADAFVSPSELQFTVHKQYDGKVCECWDNIVDFKLVWCPEWDTWFEIKVDVSESNETIKNITATTLCEAELSQINLYDIQINTDVDIARDDYVPTVIYNEDNPDASLLNRILEKAPHYSISHVDDSLKDIQRTFTFDGKTIQDALNEVATEIECLIQYNSGTNRDGEIARSISLYDLKSYCTVCGYRGSFDDVCPECGKVGTEVEESIAIDSLTVKINPIQNGSGDSSLQNERSIEGWSNVDITFDADDEIYAYPIYWDDEAGIIYGGTLNAITGELTADMIVFESTWGEGTGSYAVGSTITRKYYTLNERYDGVTDSICNICSYSSGTGETPHYSFMARQSSSTYRAYAYVYLPNDTPDTQVIQIAYRLANPITYHINTQSIQQIRTKKQFNSVYADCGDVSISYKTVTQTKSNGAIISGYGKDTNIFVSVDNLANEITYSTNVDSVKNCFRLVAGDDLMTATIRSCNPNGSSYLWYLPREMRNDMSEELQSKLDEYDSINEYYQKEYVIDLDADLIDQYNALVDKYYVYNKDLQKINSEMSGFAALMEAYYNVIDMNLFLTSGLMPTPTSEDTNAIKEASKLTSAALSPIPIMEIDKATKTTVTNAALSKAKSLIDPRYQVKVKSSSYANQQWSGIFTITNYSDEEDTQDTATIQASISNDYETYVKNNLSKYLADNTDTKYDITGLFKLDLDEFKLEIKKYGLNSLSRFSDSCQGCLNIMIEQGISDSNSQFYSGLYLPYYNKYLALQDEIQIRESEIALISGMYDDAGMVTQDGMQSIIEARRKEIQASLNFEKYVGFDLWKELIMYRREDSYENSNYISDGLSNSDLINNALQFIKSAQEEIIKSATLQHSISATLKNLLVMKEFKPIIENFSVGNWIRLRVDDKVYKLRLTNYSISFDDLKSISVEFSDVTQINDDVDDLKDLLSKASSMATSYDAVVKQAENGNNTKHDLDYWKNIGLSLTMTRILNDARTQNIVLDERGLLCRELSDFTEQYDDKQLRIINKGLYLTDDNWRTSRAGIGEFIYYDPEDGQEKNGYGVIADMLISNLILSERVGIYNKNNTIKLDKDGFTLISDTTADATSTVFKVQRKYKDDLGVDHVEDVIYLDDSGNACFVGEVNMKALRIGDNPSRDYKQNIEKVDWLIDSSSGSVADMRFTNNVLNIITERAQAIAIGVLDTLVRIDEEGLHIGDINSNKEVLIDEESMSINIGSESYSRFASNYVQFGNYRMYTDSTGGLVFRTV